MKKKVIVWLVVLLFSVVGGFVAMFYGMEVVYRILSKIIGIALLLYRSLGWNGQQR